VPEQLAPLGLRNQRVFYSMLFRAASETLLRIAADPRHLGARIGILAVLHTWSQNLQFHPHLHCLIPAGGLAPDNSRWIATKRHGFFLPVRVLSRMFRGKLLSFLKQSYRRSELCFPGKLTALSTPRAFYSLLGSLRRREWVVYSKPPFGGPEHVLKYLARYTHRVAISTEGSSASRTDRCDFAGATCGTTTGAARCDLRPLSSSAASYSTYCLLVSSSFGTLGCSPTGTTAGHWTCAEPISAPRRSTPVPC
jgi:Putative transposase